MQDKALASAGFISGTGLKLRLDKPNFWNEGSATVLVPDPKRNEKDVTVCAPKEAEALPFPDPTPRSGEPVMPVKLRPFPLPLIATAEPPDDNVALAFPPPSRVPWMFRIWS